MSNSSSPNINYQALLKDALLEMRQLRAELTAIESQKTEAIAVIGMACRFPGGANNPEAFWQLLQNGVNAVSEIPSDRWDVAAYYDTNPDAPGKMYTRYGYFIDGVDQFDARFFGISPREAAAIDPQQRLLLEVSYEALERAGQSPQQLKGSRTGVFIGVCFDDYAKYSIASNDPRQIDAYSSLGNTRSITAGRIAYVLGLQGPVMQLDTTCSSSLLALHLASESLRTGESDLALVGGVNLILAPEPMIGFCKLQALAVDGRCKTFDAAADGYGRGEGCGIVVLKRLSKAIANHDPILAVIRGSAVNHDGSSNGLTAPNGTAQSAVIRQALKNARLEPKQIQYVETHGTGTVLGDPIEVLALAKALGEGRTKDESLYIGSVKTNIGHLEGAAGIAGLIKVILALQHQQIPPHLNFQQPNPYIPWDKLPLAVPQKLTPWQDQNKQRLAGISSFGMSGTNVHIILENAPSSIQNSKFKIQNSDAIERPLHLLTLSAKTPQGLRELAQLYKNYLATPPDTHFANVCFTANAGRSHFEYRLAIPANSYILCYENLVNYLDNTTDISKSQVSKIAFLFTGQGSQYINMGRELYETQSSFRHQIDYCCELLHPDLGLDLRNLLYLSPLPSTDAINRVSPNSQNLSQTIYTQPALFVLEYALCQLWLSWGVQPDFVMGHSVGEYVAACIAGVFSLEDGLKLITNRARLMQQLPDNGKMVVVAASAADIAQQLQIFEQQISIAAINAPNNTVISGEQTAIAQLVETLQNQGIKTTILSVSHAFHSPLMELMLREFEQMQQSISYYPPQIPLVSNITGKIIGAEIATPEYWCRHIRQPVQFAAGIQTLAQEGCEVFVEIGAKPTLLSIAQTCLPEAQNLTWLPSLRSGQSDWQVMLSSLASLYMRGVNINWQNFEGDELPQRVLVPTYPFQRQRFWVEQDRIVPQNRYFHQHPLLGQRLQLAHTEKIYFQSQISQNQPLFLQHHQVFHHIVMPAAGYVEMALTAAKEIWKTDAYTIRDIVISKALFLTESTTTTLQLILQAVDQQTYQFEIASTDNISQDAAWVTHATGILQNDPIGHPPQCIGRAGEGYTTVDLTQLQTTCPQEIAVTSYYQTCQELGVEYGKSFQAIQRLWWGEKQALGEIRLSPLLTDPSYYQIHPVLLDACFQVMGAIFLTSEPSTAYLPVGVEQVRWYGQLSESLWSYVELRDESSYIADLQLLNPDGSLVATIDGLQIQPVRQDSLRNAELNTWQDWLYQVEWEEHPINSVGLLFHTLQNPSTISKHISAQFTQNQPELEAYASLLPQLEELSIACVLEAFGQLQFSLQPGEEFSTNKAMLAMGVVSHHQRLCHRLLQMLQEEGILQKQDEYWRVLRTTQPTATTPVFAHLRQTYPSATAELTLLERCTSHLPEVLQGSIDSLQLLFPEGDFSDLTQLYQNSPVAQVMNTLVQQALMAVIEQIPPESTLRILEIGAGTGSTTAHILPELAQRKVEYFFTDVSPLFLSKAQQRFASYSGVRYQLFDIEKSLSTQGFTEKSFDIVIAANVLHATQDLHQTVTNIKQLLSPGGLLILLEGVQSVRWLDLIFGLTEGWWRFQDQVLRPNYPLISSKKWQELLKDVGFESTTLLNPTIENSQFFDQQAVLIAQTPKLSRDEGERGDKLILSFSSSPPSPLQYLNATQPQCWLILADQQGVGLQLAAALEAQGATCHLVFTADSNFTLPFTPSHLINLWGLDVPHTNEMTTEQLMATQQVLCGQVSHWLQTLSTLATQPQWWQVTQGSVATGVENDIPGMAAATLWGMSKVMRLEHPLRCRCLDLDPVRSLTAQLDILLQELLANSPEEDIAWRGQTRRVARLARYSPIDTSLRQLIINQRGTLENLYFQTINRRSPATKEVEICIRATGLNFRDVLNALDLYPGDAGLLGCECVGDIVAVGTGVKNLQVGQTVMALASGSFSNYVTVDAQMVVPKPQHLSVTSAATIPVAFLTAFYTLYHLAKIRAGERILIHAGAGGVGQAAIQIAQMAGAEVFATASPSKWEILQKLGVQHIFNSRTLDFSAEIAAQTQGEGVDIILNSLGGEFIPQSLAVLKPHGRFVEIGKIGVWSESQVKQVKLNADYFLVDIVDLCRQQPELVQQILQQLVEEFANHRLQPLPAQVFPMANVVDAFRYMQQSKHIGKVVVSQLMATGYAANQIPPTPLKKGGFVPPVSREGFVSPVLKKGFVLPLKQEDLVPPFLRGASALGGSADLKQLAWVRGDQILFKSDRTYLITGGLGGLGLLVAQWLVDMGARHLVLLGRNAPTSAAKSRIQQLEAAGATVTVAQVDVSQQQDLATVLTQIQESTIPLAGVIHAAGLLDDGVMLQLNWQRWEKVMAAKVMGAWNLHLLTQNTPLDYFIMFSSATALFGSPGQANHVAANTFLDTLAHYRTSQGLPAMSINWGIWSQIGSAAQPQVTSQMEQRGIRAIAPIEGIQVLQYLLTQPIAQVGVVPIDWRQFTQLGLSSRFLERFETPVPSLTPTTSSILEQLSLAAQSDRYDLLNTYVCQQIAQVLGFQAHAIDFQAGFFDLGMDSLTAIEFKNRLQTDLKSTLPATVAFDYPNIKKLVPYLIQEVLHLNDSQPSQIAQDKADSSGSELSEDEIADLLAQELLEIKQEKF
ncbi:SDR family NAD(P)-dependent oxidoreductase [Nostoc sp. CHAB 5784]|uniref:type I polyketide synthase n=1 Tax=Nostoc mirabile TaxID=2907820 RepID=UPI001E4B9B84|nr:type I polyketide synthase [Nostoc mirabile]MCC5667832.1 SDR family NAD(P)-dependent oxidoreductase [Nostoc mirabile CHAB5784]